MTLLSKLAFVAVAASRDLFVPQPGYSAGSTVAYTGSPVAYGPAVQPVMTSQSAYVPAATIITPDAEESVTGSTLAAGCAVSMLAVVGYSMTRTPSSPSPTVDLEDGLLELAGPMGTEAWSRTVSPNMAAKAAPKKVAPKKAAAKKPVGVVKPTKVAKKPVAKKPVAKKPVAKKPVARKPVARKPVVRKPIAKKAPVKRAAVKSAPAKVGGESMAGNTFLSRSTNDSTGLMMLRERTFNSKRKMPPGQRPIGQADLGSSIKPGDVGTTRPLGVYDPLRILTNEPEKYRRWQEMEIKHGRIAMAATVHVLVTCAGGRWDGYVSKLSFPPIKFEDIPGGTLGSWEALPTLGWFQIVCLVALLDNSLFAQDPNLEPGDVVGDRLPWVRYKDPATRKIKLNAERNNGRLAMMGIFGMMTNEALTGNPLYPLLTPAQGGSFAVFAQGTPLADLTSGFVA